ncbi:MAG: preprotein translocase subunit SecA [Candidatus Shapirobacteria bacterium]|jgi:preprotein translocase subunit SecA
MLSFLKSFFDESHKRIKSLEPLIAKINRFEKDISVLSDEILSKKTETFKKQLADGQNLDAILPEAFAVVREAIRRSIGERAFDVQLMSAIVLHQGGISEQKTGEGKTHSVAFAAYLNALTGQGVHIITPNDYLSRVGAGWYPKALNLLGLSIGCIIHEQSFIYDPSFTDPKETFDDRLAHLRPVSRKEAYQADITYGTNNEFGFDYLRDHMVSSPNDIVQRSHYFAIVDEVDFVLIDEARTPLIISSPNNQPVDKYYKFAKIAAELQPTDYVIDEKSRSATLSEYGIRKVERVLSIKNLYEESFETIHYIENAIKARALFHKDKDYVVKDNEVIIVDEFTGRLMYGRRWSDGLHQAVEAKENVPVQRESQTWATITFQNFFRLYQKLAGMTGTAATEAEEFKRIYHLDVIVIPTNKVLKRLDDQDLIYKTQRSKYTAVATKVEELHRQGQPVLIGTTSIEKNDIISSLLSKKGVPHQVLNAKNHRSEAEIIAMAGKKGAVTVATNMAGRGVDIILGGPRPIASSDKTDIKNSQIQTSDWQKSHDEVVAFGGLYVIGTERHESRRIDNQLRGRSGRQGDPGFSQFYVSLEDDLMRIFGGEKISNLMTRFNMAEDVPLTHPLVTRVLEQIQVKVEGYNFDIRKNLVEYDDVINKQRQIIYSLREKTLFNLQNQPQSNTDELQKILTGQITQIVSQNQNSETGQYQTDNILLEFFEILPQADTDRSRLKAEIAESADPAAYLNTILSAAFSTRQHLFGSDIFNHIVSYSVISTLDPLWVEHLTALDDLRDGVRLRGYAQKDPLIEYRQEGYTMFQELLTKYRYNLARKIFRLEPVFDPQITPDHATETRGSIQPLAASAAAGSSATSSEITPDRVTAPAAKSPSRNDLCPCGSGKKYKKCHYPQYG